MNKFEHYRKGERGSAAVKFFFIVIVLMTVAHAAYNYVPVAYSAENLRTEMHTAVVQGLALPGKMSPVDNVKSRIQQSVKRHGAPPNTLVDVKQKGNVIMAHVVYNQQVTLLPFGLYNYNYRFDYTATPTGFLADSAP